MKVFEFISVALSFVIGLGIAHLLTAIVALFRSRKQVQLHWMPFVWAAMVFLWMIQYWWGIFELSLIIKNWALGAPRARGLFRRCSNRKYRPVWVVAHRAAEPTDHVSDYLSADCLGDEEKQDTELSNAVEYPTQSLRVRTVFPRYLLEAYSPDIS